MPLISWDFMISLGFPKDTAASQVDPIGRSKENPAP
jgi:hypothetical protein